MPRNGSGTYSLPTNSWFPAINGVTATSTDWNTTAQDIQAALTQSVSSDGQTPMTGPLAMGNNKVTGLANGSANTDAAALGQVGRYVANCRIGLSGGNIVLFALNGNLITINGALQTIPGAGVLLAPTGLTPGTLYYIYVFMSGSTMTLEASTTGHTRDLTTGIEIKSGDATRTLVGMARPIAGPLWQDSLQQRFVVSWFNRQPVGLIGVYTANRSYGAAVYGEPNSEIRNEFLTWPEPAVSAFVNGSAAHSTAGSEIRTTVGLDGGANDGYSTLQTPVAGQVITVASSFIGKMSEGYHYTTLLCTNISGAGTATYSGSGSVGARTTLQTVIQG